MADERKQSEYFSVRDFVLLSWRYKWIIIIVTGIFAVTSVYYAMSVPNQYKSEILVVPSEEQQGGGLAALANQFSGLASLAGINIRGKGGDNTLVAIDTFRSKGFIMRFIEKHDLLVPLMAANNWDPINDKLIINPAVYDQQQDKWVRKVSFPFTAKPSLQEAYEVFRDRLTLQRDTKSGILTISFEFYSPHLAQQWLTKLVAEFNAHMKEIDRKRSVKSIEYLHEQIRSTQVAELRNVFYQLVEEQTKNAMLSEAREEFVFQTIDPAIVPQLKSKPSRAVICLVITVLGFMLSLMIVHIRQLFIGRRTEAVN